MSAERVDSSPKTPSPAQLVQSIQTSTGSGQRSFQRRSIENDTCYLCNQKGHWSRDCPLKSMRKSMPSESSPNSIDDPDFPRKRCPCGHGFCRIVTSKTERNPGRKFYSCPATGCRKCDFFEWCDTASLDQSPDVANPPYPTCPCGAGQCKIFTAKEGRNAGRKFFVCRVKKGQGACNFFQWQDSLGKDCDMIHGLSHESIQVNNSSSISNGEKDIGAATDCKEGGDGFKLQPLCCNGSHKEQPLLSTCNEGFRNHLLIEEFGFLQDREKYINELEEPYCSGIMSNRPLSSSGESFQMERGDHLTIETSDLHEKGEERGSNRLDDMLVDGSHEECLLSICNEGKEEEVHLAMEKLSLCEGGKNYFEELGGLFPDCSLEKYPLSSSLSSSSSMEVSKAEAGHFLATEGNDLYEAQEKHDGYGPNNMLYTGLNEEWSPSMHDEAFEVNKGRRNTLTEKLSFHESGMDYFIEQSRTFSNLTMEKGSASSFGEEFEVRIGHHPPIKRLSFHEEEQHGNGPMDSSFKGTDKEYPPFTFDEEFQVRDQTDGSNSLYPMCSCAAGICRTSIIIGGRNDGRRFFICPVPKGQGACGFFAWQDSPSESNDMTESLSEESVWLNYSQSISDSENDPLATTGYRWGEEGCKIALSSGSLEKGSSSSRDEGFLVEEETEKMVIKNPSLFEAVEADLKGKPQKAPSSGFRKGPLVSPSTSTTMEGFQVEVSHDPLTKRPNPHEVAMSSSKKCQVEETDQHPVSEKLESHREAAAVAQLGKCFRCGKKGHLTKECARSLICFRCGKVGHQKKDCSS